MWVKQWRAVFPFAQGGRFMLIIPVFSLFAFLASQTESLLPALWRLYWIFVLGFHRSADSVSRYHYCVPMSVRFMRLILCTLFRQLFFQLFILLLRFSYFSYKVLSHEVFALLWTPFTVNSGSSWRHISCPCLSTAGFVCAVIPGTEGPPPGSPDVSLLAHPGRRQPAVEGEMQGGRWVSATDAGGQHAARAVCSQCCACSTGFKTNVRRKGRMLCGLIRFFLSANRHRWASAPQEEKNCQAWLHSQPLEECLHQAAQNRH